MGRAQVAFYGASLILALDFLHKNGVLHRDIKVRSSCHRPTYSFPYIASTTHSSLFFLH